MIRAAALLLVLVLAGVLFMQWRDWPHPPAPGAAPGTGGTEGDGTAPAAVPPLPGPPEAKETYATVAERTLFRPQRRPEPPPSPEPAPEQTTAADASLEGVGLSAVLITPEVVSAWIREPGAAQLKRLKLGEEQSGWTVKAILPDRIVLERQGETNELIWRDVTKLAAAPPAAPAPPRPNQTSRPAQPPPPTPVAPRPPQPPAGASQRAPGPGPGQRGVPPTPPQPKPNARKPLSQRPQ